MITTFLVRLGLPLASLHFIYIFTAHVVMLNMSDEVKFADVAGRKVQWDPAQMRKIQEHPCFSEKACHTFGRCHIPVAPKCNIQCNYCIRDFDCVNESRPGVTTRVLNPDESIVLAITGNGLKTVAAVNGHFEENGAIRPRLAEFEEKFLNLAPASA